MVKTIFLRLNTRSVEGAGTDGDIYLGIGGREFYVDTKYPDYDDFKAGSVRTYIFGEVPDPSSVPQDFDLFTTVRNPKYNDPRQPDPLDTDTMDQFPVYIRFEPEDDDDFWCLEGVIVKVNTLTGTTQDKRYAALGEENYLWFGHGRGKYLALSPVLPGPLG